MNRRIRDAALPWIAGLVVAASLCSTYFLMFAYRKTWQSHFPKLAAEWVNNGRFTVLGIYSTENGGEELIYAARAKEAADHWLPFDPFIKENHSRRILVTDYLTYRVIGLFERLISDMTWTWIAVRFCCCLLWFVLIYHISLRLTNSSSLAFFCAAFVTCQSYILNFLFIHGFVWSAAPSALLHNVWAVLTYGRTESAWRLPRPGLTYAFFFALALLTAKAADRNNWKWAALSGAAGGLFSYIRGDVFSLYFAACGLFTVVYSWKNGLQRTLFFSAVLVVLVSLPWFAATFPVDPDFSARFVDPSHALNGAVIPYVAVGLTLILTSADALALFIASLLLADAAILTMMAITGRAVSPFNWTSAGNIFLFLALASLIPAALRRRDSLWKSLGAAAVLCAFLQGISFAALHFPFYGLPRDYDGALQWLNRNAARDQVVLALDPEAVALAGAYTHGKSVLTFPLAMVSDLPMSENASRLIAALEYFGVKRDEFVRGFLTASVSDRRAYDQGDRDNKISEVGSFFHQNPPERTLAMIKAAEDKRAPLPAFDYVWFGDFERRYADKRFPAGRGLKEVYRNPTVVLYQNVR